MPSDRNTGDRNVPANVENLLTNRLQFVNLHGCLRGFNLELGKNPDTGGQTRYVWELAQSLGEIGVKVDIFTRLFEDDDPSYAVPIEEYGNVRIVRIRCGGPLYQRKELLWPFLPECVTGIIRFNEQDGITPAVLHGHYAESGFVAMQLAEHYQIPLVFTGHSFGIPKRDSFAQSGKDMEEAEADFNFLARIEAETAVMQRANLIVCNSKLEVEGQIRLYGDELATKCRPIPPGVSNAFAPTADAQDSRVGQLLEPFLRQPDKPMILAIARPELKKNLGMLIKAFGKYRELQDIANLVILAGSRTDITNPEKTPLAVKEVILELLCLEDRYNLRGKLALPKKHNPFADVPALYRLAARGQGVFVNAALTEPFGLTLLEAAASGLPIVATLKGGPPEIVANCGNGLLVDPRDAKQIAKAISTVLGDQDRWRAFSENGVSGVEQYYSWNVHRQTYLNLLATLCE
jgi:sucrose-phosphate synthase